MQRRHRPLLPGLETTGGAPSASRPSGPLAGLTRRPKPLRVACNACRAKRISCGGQKPTCRPCVERKTECVYREDRRTGAEEAAALKTQNKQLQGLLDDHVELLGHLASLPDDEALDMLRTLRSTSNLRAVLESAKGRAGTQHRPSAYTAAQGIAAPAGSLLEFELSARHPALYIRLEPLDAPLLTEFQEMVDIQMSSSTPITTPSLSDSTPSSAVEIVGPPRPRPLCDARLHKLEIGFWTRVAISNQLAASAISFYLENDHPITGFFDADLFVRDLVELRLTFCSAFLVSSLLYFSCQAYARIDSRSLVFVPEFFREATALWHAERDSSMGSTIPAAERISNPITTLAAAELMSLGCQCNGEDAVGYEFLNAGRRMAQELGLMDVPPGSDRLPNLANKSEQWISASSHVAWGAYNWSSLHSFYFRDPPILHSPVLPIPGQRSQEAKDIGSSMAALPKYMGQTFSTFCQFWTLAQEMAVLYLGQDERTLAERVPLAFAESKYQKLLAWTNTVAESMALNDHSPAHVMIFHMFFHSMVIRLFYPFIQGTANYSHKKLHSFSSDDSSATAIITASLNQLKRLALLFQKRHPSTMWAILVNPPLVQLGDVMLNRRLPHGPDRRLYFLLCLRTWIEMYQSYAVCWDVAKGFLSRAMRDGVMSSVEAKELMTELLRRGVHHKVPEQAMSSIVIDYDLAEGNLEVARVKVLAERFDELALYDEFTTGT